VGTLPPPRMLDVAAASTVHALLEEGDPSRNGLWECATPAMLEMLPRMLCWARLWSELGGRVLGSLSFMAQVKRLAQIVCLWPW
jgi:hypothetical protein